MGDNFGESGKEVFLAVTVPGGQGGPSLGCVCHLPSGRYLLAAGPVFSREALTADVSPSGLPRTLTAGQWALLSGQASPSGERTHSVTPRIPKSAVRVGQLTEARSVTLTLCWGTQSIST